MDEARLRKILSAHSKTPLELLYLETGNIPIRFIIMARRLNFLWYILNEEEDSLIRTCLEAQLDRPSKGDWIRTVKENLHELKIDMDLQTIAGLGKEDFKDIIKKSVNQLSFDYLQKLRETHSKAKDLKATSPSRYSHI